MQVPYILKAYKRDSHFRSPPELFKLHPLGKSPLLEVPSPLSNDSKIIAESVNIANYILEKYDTTNKLIPIDGDERLQMNYFLNYSEGTLQPVMVSLLLNHYAKTKAPFGTRFLVGLVVDAMNNAYYKPELIKNLNFLEDTLKKQNEVGSDYFVGKKLSAADIMLSFPVCTSFFSDKSGISSVCSKDEMASWPQLKKWCEVIKNEPKLVKVKNMTKEYEDSSRL